MARGKRYICRSLPLLRMRQGFGSAPKKAFPRHMLAKVVDDHAYAVGRVQGSAVSEPDGFPDRAHSGAVLGWHRAWQGG